MCKDFWRTWLPTILQDETLWDHIHKRDRRRCASPSCNNRRVTLHNVLEKIRDGGGDEWHNLISLCMTCHLDNIHERGTLQVHGRAPDALTWLFGRKTTMIVEGRTKRAL